MAQERKAHAGSQKEAELMKQRTENDGADGTLEGLLDLDFRLGFAALEVLLLGEFGVAFALFGGLRLRVVSFV